MNENWHQFLKFEIKKKMKKKWSNKTTNENKTCTKWRIKK